MKQATVTVKHPTGLHYRPAGLFVFNAKKFSCSICVLYAGNEADAKNVNSVINLHVETGGGITIKCDGPDEDQALDALANLVNNNFPGL